MLNLICTAGLSFLFILLFNTGVFAELLGEKIKPFFSAREIYSSNIFRVKDKEQLREIIGDDKMSDFVTVFSAGLGLKYQISRQEVDIVMRRDFLRYSHYRTQDSEQQKGDCTKRFFLTSFTV